MAIPEMESAKYYYNECRRENWSTCNRVLFLLLYLLTIQKQKDMENIKILCGVILSFSVFIAIVLTLNMTMTANNRDKLIQISDSLSKPRTALITPERVGYQIVLQDKFMVVYSGNIVITTISYNTELGRILLRDNK
jgi:hypothetical protein